MGWKGWNLIKQIRIGQELCSDLWLNGTKSIETRAYDKSKALIRKKMDISESKQRKDKVICDGTAGEDQLHQYNNIILHFNNRKAANFGNVVVQIAMISTYGTYNNSNTSYTFFVSKANKLFLLKRCSNILNAGRVGRGDPGKIGTWSVFQRLIDPLYQRAQLGHRIMHQTE